MTPPRETYEDRLRLRRESLQAERRRDDRVVVGRAVVAVVFVALAFAAYRGLASWEWLALPAITFAALVVAHERVLRRKSRAERAVAWHEDALERLDGRWSGKGRGGLAFLPERHPYAADLDLFGEGSLFERVNAARTGAGEACLARWLLAPSDPDAVRERQEAARDLRERLDFREDLALAGEAVAPEVHPERIRAWATSPASRFAAGARIAALLLGTADVVSLGLWIAGATSALPFAVCAAAAGSFALLFRNRVRAIVHAADRPGQELRVLAAVLARIEREPFAAPRLLALRRELESAGDPPARAIAKLARIADLAEARRNQLVAPLAALFLGTTQTAMAIEAWRASHGSAVPRWLDACGEIEAIASIAGYAYENPSDPFPEIAPGPGRFEAQELGHPLIPRERCVANDLTLDASRPLLLVSGSNMSGKSTLLRSVGLATVMAQAGLPVRAARLSLSPLSVGATLRIQDSLREGASRFYAEITRVREVVDLAAGDRPALFLLDELLSGTNSHDRAAGAEAILRGLVSRGAIGLATTHDLALTRLAEGMAPRAGNVHFEDRLEGGRLVFDYRLREGTVTHSNAIALMRSVGLDV